MRLPRSSSFGGLREGVSPDSLTRLVRLLPCCRGVGFGSAGEDHCLVWTWEEPLLRKGGGVQHSTMTVSGECCLVGSSDGLVQCSEALVISQRGMESYRRGLRRLLSAVHVNSKTKLLWECATGHQWDSCLNHVKNHKTRCPVCVPEQRA